MSVPDIFSPCGHSGYWIGNYGTCMACRAEKAEKLAHMNEMNCRGEKMRREKAEADMAKATEGYRVVPCCCGKEHSTWPEWGDCNTARLELKLKKAEVENARLVDALLCRVDVFRDLGRRIAAASTENQGPVMMVDSAELCESLLDAVEKGEAALSPAPNFLNEVRAKVFEEAAKMAKEKADFTVTSRYEEGMQNALASFGLDLHQKAAVDRQESLRDSSKTGEVGHE